MPDLGESYAPAPAAIFLNHRIIIGAETTMYQSKPTMYPATWPYIWRQDKKTRQSYKYVYNESSSIRSGTAKQPVPPVKNTKKKGGKIEKLK